jgi:Glycosyl hydrolases family 16
VAGTPLDELLAAGYELDVEDGFDGEDLDRSLWLPHYLPHWSSREESAARYEVGDGRLQLVIEADQQPWCPEFDGETRVSSLQTALVTGQSRFKPGLVVREPQDDVALYTPQFGVFVLRARALDDPTAMVALWMIGLEDRRERSGEICVCEIFGRDVTGDAAAIGLGVHPWGDATLADDFEQVRVPIDVRELHEYAAEWTPERVTFFVDGRPVKTVAQSPQYPMQFMLGIYEFRDAPTTYPKRFTIDWFRGYRPRA